MAEYCYNDSCSSSSEMAPFYANHGFDPCMRTTPNDSISPVANERARTLQSIAELLPINLLRASADQAKYANTKRLPRPIKENDMVYLNTKDLAPLQGSKKLEQKF